MLQWIWCLWSKGPSYGKRENKAWNQERKNEFSLGGTQEEGESKVLPEDSQGGESKVIADKIKGHW